MAPSGILGLTNPCRSFNLAVFFMSRRAIFLTLILLTSCGQPVPRQLTKVTPPAPTVIIPVVPAPIDPIPAPIPTVLPAENRPDAIGLAIVEARMRFEKGDEYYKTGFLSKAKDEFDSAVDVLLESSADYPENARIRREITDLTARVHALEMTAISEGDGFTDEPQDHAAIDDLENVPTFPDVDPKVKQAVEEEVSEITHDLPIEINNRVLGFLNYYGEGRGRGTIQVGLQRMGRYQPMIERITKEEGVPQDLIYLAQSESAFLPKALSRAKAKGMWQFISSRGKEYGLRQTWWIDERSDPEKSTRAAARHLKDLYEEFGDWYLAMAAYNAGPVRVEKAIAKAGGAKNFWILADKKLLPKETINYIPNILALTIIGKNPEKYGFTIDPDQPMETERVSVEKATDLRVIAEAIEVPVEDLQMLNAHVLRMTTPPDDPDFQLVLPRGYSGIFYEKIAGLPESERVLFSYHAVRKGDTLGGVAKKYGTTVTALTQANNISAKKALQVGQSLIIPVSGASPKAAQTTAAAAKPGPGTAYTVRKGDTLGKIAARYGVSVSELQGWNKLASTQIAVGKKLVVAAAAPKAPVKTAADSTSALRKVVHQVKVGETLNKIATAYKTTVNAIRAWNKQDDLSVLHPGDRITIFLGERN